MLETPDHLGLSETVIQQTHQIWSTFNNVHARLAQEGFVPLPAPKAACPAYLDDSTLTAHDSRTLALEFGKYKAWRDFVTQRLSFTLQILVETRNEMKAIEGEARRAAKGSTTAKKLTKEELLELVQLNNPRYIQLKMQEQENDQLQIWYEGEKERYASAMNLLSRMLTMRGQDIEQGIRQGNIGSQGAGVPMGF